MLADVDFWLVLLGRVLISAAVFVIGYSAATRTDAGPALRATRQHPSRRGTDG